MAIIDFDIGCATFPGKEQNIGMATKTIELPGQLVDKVNEAAAQEEITPEEFVRDAVETRLSRAEWQKTLQYGDRNARARGLRPEDVEVEISAVRTERTR
jgi:predicted transcriptional regulator